MESSNCELKRATSAPETTSTSTSAKLKAFSSEKIPPLAQSSSCTNQTPEATEAPRTQEMEPYRIPASVFERSPSSSSPMEWSTASNESLFSIHTSFTNDQFYMLTPPSTMSDQMFSYHDSAGLAEATMLEVIKESESQNPTKSLAEVRHARRSEGSNTSNKSFAFSIMGAEPGSSTRLHSSLRSNHEQAQTTQTLQPTEAEPKTPIEAANQAAQSSWFSCFSCCSVSK